MAGQIPQRPRHPNPRLQSIGQGVPANATPNTASGGQAPAAPANAPTPPASPVSTPPPGTPPTTSSNATSQQGNPKAGKGCTLGLSVILLVLIAGFCILELLLSAWLFSFIPAAFTVVAVILAVILWLVDPQKVRDFLSRYDPILGRLLDGVIESIKNFFGSRRATYCSYGLNIILIVSVIIVSVIVLLLPKRSQQPFCADKGICVNKMDDGQPIGISDG